MSKYTVEIRRIIDLYGREEVESWFKDYELEDFLTTEEIKVIEDRGTWSKDKLATKIVDYYFMREIGFETPALFKHKAKVKMLEIMEEKLPLIYSSSIKYDPLVNVDYTETYSRNINDTGSQSSSSINNSSGLTINNNTPQSNINKESILNGKYASETQAGESTSSVSDNSNSQTNSNETSSKNVKGNSGVSATAQAMIKQYRNNIRAIDKEIIEELNILFMGIF